MAAVSTIVHVCGAFPVGGKRVNVVQSRSSSVHARGWKKHLYWRLEPEVTWFRHGSTKPRHYSSFHLCVTATATASSKDSQNVDLPHVFPKRRKRPSVMPGRTKRLPAVWVDPSLIPPGNGLLVEHLIPVARDVMEAKTILTKGVQLLLKDFPVVACRACPEVHIGSRGHSLRTCEGPQSSTRNSLHQWVKGNVNDILVPVEAYHLADRLALPVRHEQRFDVDRLSAVEELCIQAGVDVPEYPTNRCREPVQPATRKKAEDASWLGQVDFTYYTSDGSYQLRKSSKPERHIGPSRIGEKYVTDNQEENSGGYQVAEMKAIDDQTQETEGLLDRGMRRPKEQTIVPLADIGTDENLKSIAEKTILAWERMREGAKKLMVKYRVLACGYCPEIHVGPRGHRARVCGAFKHQWRQGKHGWQDAALDDLIPPQYVWHVRERFGPPLENALRKFYGKAPAVVELCVHAGASIPESYKPLMRLDIAIPTLNESENAI